MSEGKSTRDAIRTFVGLYRQQQNYELDEKGTGMTVRSASLTGAGRDCLSFRARAPSVECPAAVEATYSMRSSLRGHQTDYTERIRKTHKNALKVIAFVAHSAPPHQ